MAVSCQACGIDLPPDHSGKCPRCGGVTTISVGVFENINVQEGLTTGHIRQFYETNKKALGVGVGATIVASLVGFLLGGMAGLVVGTMLGIIFLLALPTVKTKVIEKIFQHHK